MADTYTTKLRRKVNRQQNEEILRATQLYKKLKKRGYSYWEVRDLMRLAEQGKRVWDRLTNEEKQIVNNMSRNPSWWNRMTSTRPVRADTRCKLKNVQIDDTDDDEQFYFDLKKPMIYFW